MGKIKRYEVTCRACGRTFVSIKSKDLALTMLDIHMKSEHN